MGSQGGPLGRSGWKEDVLGGRGGARGVDGSERSTAVASTSMRFGWRESHGAAKKNILMDLDGS